MRHTGAALATMIALFCGPAVAGAEPGALARPAAVRAAPPPEPVPAAIAGYAAEIDGAESDLRQITTALHGRAADDDALRGMIDAVPAIRTRLAHALAGLTPLLTDANERLAQLGSPPGPGALPEDPEITRPGRTCCPSSAPSAPSSSRPTSSPWRPSRP